jgi:hypothetical protein
MTSNLQPFYYTVTLHGRVWLLQYFAPKTPLWFWET